MPAWIDFKQLRESLKFKNVLDYYKVELKPKGQEQHAAYCPLPTHNGRGSGRTLSVNIVRGLWRCFGCREGGNVLDFAVRMERLDPKNPGDVRKVALLLTERFRMDTASQPRPQKSDPRRPPAMKLGQEAPRGDATGHARLDTPRVVNAPLDFTLKNLDPNHQSLVNWGFKPETIAHFGVGYCPRGMLAGRIAIPLHDAGGNLIGYAGRVIDDTTVTAQNPKYKFPADRERQGVKHLFRPGLVLYNGHHQQAPLDELVVVQGFTEVWWLHQAGVRHAVALMDVECSDEQAAHIAALMSSKGRIIITSRTHAPTGRFAESVLVKISPRYFVHWVQSDAEQQADIIAADIQSAFTRL